MRRSTRRIGLVVAALAASLYSTLVSTEAAAQTPPPSSETATASEARLKDLIRTGIAAYRAQDYATARSALLEATKLSSDPLPIGILADTEMKLERYADAAGHWSSYLKALPADPSSDRAEAEAQLELCRKHVGSIVLSVEPHTATVLVDGAPREVIDGVLWLEPGTHRLQAKLDGRDSESTSVSVRAGDRLERRLTVPKSSPVPAAVAPASALNVSFANAPAGFERDSSTKTVVLIGGGALTLVAAGLGTTFLLMNRSAKADADTASQTIASQATNSGACVEPNAPSACGDLQSAHDKMKSTATVSDVAFVAAGVLGIATVGAYLLWPRSKKPQDHADLSVAPYWAPGGQGVSASLRF